MASAMGMRAPHLLAVSALALLAGCAVGPDFVKPTAPEVPRYTREPLVSETTSAAVAEGAAQRFVAGLDIPGQWWTLFHSPALSAMIAQALKANPDLQAAQAALRVAQENVAAQQGFYYPSVSGDFSASRQKNATAVLSPTLTSGAPYFNLFTPQLSISYVPDVFGLNRRTVEGLVAQAEAQRYALAASYLTLTSNVVAAAVQEASLRGQIKATQDMIALETELLELFRVQLAKGQIAEIDVAAQEAALAQVETALPPLQKQLAQQRDLLAALIGRFPSEAPAETFELSDLELPQELPVSLPAQMVEQRPDVLQAEANLHQASAEIGVAVANRLPSLALTADVGTTAAQANRLFTRGTGFWTIAASLTQPIFDGGTLLHKERAARAAFEQSVAQYRGTVITAMQNVADTLHALRYDADALKAAAHAESTAARSLELVRAQLRLGAVNYLALLNAQMTYQQAVIGLVQAQAGRLADTAALFQALGGGWWKPPPAAEGEGAGISGMREAKPAGADRGWLMDAIFGPFGF